MDFESIEDIVAFAIGQEQEAAEFYRAATNQESIQVNKNVLMEYAEEEEKHEKMLKDFSFDKNAIGKYKFKQITDLKRSDYMMEMEYKTGMTYFEVMRIAMKKEEQAYKMYLDMAESTENEDQSNIFKILAQEELKHKNSLEVIYDDHLAKTGD